MKIMLYVLLLAIIIVGYSIYNNNLSHQFMSNDIHEFCKSYKMYDCNNMRDLGTLDNTTCKAFAIGRIVSHRLFYQVNTDNPNDPEAILKSGRNDCDGKALVAKACMDIILPHVKSYIVEVNNLKYFQRHRFVYMEYQNRKWIIDPTESDLNSYYIFNGRAINAESTDYFNSLLNSTYQVIE